MESTQELKTLQKRLEDLWNYLTERDIFVVVLLVMLGYQAYHVMVWTTEIGDLLTYWSYSPNKYRLFNQVLIWLHVNGIADFYVMDMVAFIGSMMATYFIMKSCRHTPKQRAVMLFLVIVTWVCTWGLIDNALMYPLLALVARYRHDRRVTVLFLPLVFVKEIALWIALGFLLFYTRDKAGRENAMLSAWFSGFAYVIAVAYVGNDLFMPTLFPLGGMTWFNVLSGVAMVVIVIFFLLGGGPRVGGTYRNLVWYAIPIFLFTQFWEPHLWLPLFVMHLTYTEEVSHRRA